MRLPISSFAKFSNESSQCWIRGCSVRDIEQSNPIQRRVCDVSIDLPPTRTSPKFCQEFQFWFVLPPSDVGSKRRLTWLKSKNGLEWITDHNHHQFRLTMAKNPSSLWVPLSPYSYPTSKVTPPCHYRILKIAMKTQRSRKVVSTLLHETNGHWSVKVPRLVFGN